MADGEGARRAGGDFTPRTREDITVTLKCNNSCRFCPRSALSHIRVRSEEELDERLRAIRAHSPRVLLSGGEVTLLPDIVELIGRCQQLGFEQIAIISNGRRLADIDLARQLVGAGLTEVCLSIYSLEPAVHDAMTSQPGSLGETLGGLDNLVALSAEHASLNVRINTLLAADNADDMLPLLRGLADRGVRRFLVADMMLSDAFPDAVEHSRVVDIARSASRDPALRDCVVQWRGFPLCLFRELPEVQAEPHDVDTALGAEDDLDTYFAEFYRSFEQVDACASCAAKDRCLGAQKRYLAQHGSESLVALQPREPRRPAPVVHNRARVIDENPLQKLVLRRSLAHQAKVMKQRPELLSLPILMLENGCYHECLFCLSKPLPPTSATEVKRWLADNRDLGLERLGIAGNEPLAHPDIDNILAAAREVGFSRFEVLTSAAPLADLARARALFALGVTSYAVPLYAADAATHDAITQTLGSHADTVRAIENLLGLGADIHVHANLLRQNLGGLAALEELVKGRWQIPLAIIPIRPKAANLPYDELVPRYADLIAQAQLENSQLSSLVAIPLCVAGQVQSPARPSGDIIADVLKLYVLDQPFVKPDKCKPCRHHQGCAGTFQAYLDLHGDDELIPA